MLWDGTSEQAPTLAAAFGSVTASLTDDNGVPVACTPAAFGLPKLLFRCPTCCGDCCTPAVPWGELPIADFLARCRVVTAREGFEFRYLDRPDLIWMRRAVARAKDLRRAKELERLAGLAG